MKKRCSFNHSLPVVPMFDMGVYDIEVYYSPKSEEGENPEEEEKKAERINLSAEVESLKVGDSIRILVSPVPEDAPIPELTWESSNPGVAEVDASGNVSILGAGDAIITATPNDSDIPAATFEIHIEAEEEEESMIPEANEILYITSNEETIDKGFDQPYFSDDESFTLTDNRYENGVGRATFSSPVTKITIFLPWEGLKKIYVPESVSEIGKWSFSDNSELEGIYFFPTVPPVVEDVPGEPNGGMFENTNECPIYVPAESVEAYKEASQWNVYASRIMPME